MTALSLMTDDEIASYGRADDAGFGALQTERGPLPLVALRVRAQISGLVAATEVVQTFANAYGTPIEATYIFPLPDRAAVHRFRMEVNGRVVEGVVTERAAARAEYDAAIAAGQRAAIAEEERANVFTLRVGNLLPNERATVTLSLVGPLPVDDGEVTFQFPLVVAPRYIPGVAFDGEQAGVGTEPDTHLVPDASRITPPVRLPGLPNPVQLAIEVAFGDAPSGIASSLHAILVDDGPHSGARTPDDQHAPLHPGRGHAVRVQPGERLDRDFILRWRVDGAGRDLRAAGSAAEGQRGDDVELRSTLVCADDADGKGGTFVLSLVPPSTQAVAQKPRDLVFVIDRSGSMGGWKMVAARRAVARMIDSLTSRDRFCVLAFDNTIEPIPSLALAGATDRQRFAAVEQLAKVDARGGTELEAPLVQALALLSGGYADRERAIVLVTDGQVGNEDQILKKLATGIKNVRIFTLGIDQAVNAGFLRRLAGAGAGLCELVESEDRLDAVMAKVHRRIGAPIATELQLAPHELAIDRSSLSPSRTPDVYAGAPVVVFGRYTGTAPAGAAIELTGTSFGDAFRARVERTRDAGAASWLGASWARARIRDLEDRYAAGEHEHERAIVDVSTRYGVLSRFTAFLAVDRSQVANPGGGIVQVVMPVETPSGWVADAIRTQSGVLGGTVPMPPTAMAPRMRAPSGMASAAAPPMAAPMNVGTPAGAPPPAPMAKRVARAALFEAADRGEAPPEPISATPYLEKLRQLARALEQATTKPALGAARQQLAQWIDDVRAIGLTDLADAVAAIAGRLRGTLDEATARAVAKELDELAAAPPSSEPPKKKSRLAFWK